MRKNTYGIAIALAWPETLCKHAGAWYDNLMHLARISIKGYYKVGHAAIVLVNAETGKCHYFDFGRYHAPHGFGRVRSELTDHDLEIKTVARVGSKGVSNLDEILRELLVNPSTHGTGRIYGAQVDIDFEKSVQHAVALQEEDFIPYGPFIRKGTNCSRFVNSILRAGSPAFFQRSRLKFPWMITPTPMWNLSALGSEIVSFLNEASTHTQSVEEPELELIYD